jgi:hypothetical protein
MKLGQITPKLISLFEKKLAKILKIATNLGHELNF